MNAELCITQSSMFPKSAPITIPSNEESTEYSLKKNVFDPAKSSPPNSFNNRLLKRLSLNKFNEQHNYRVNNF